MLVEVNCETDFVAKGAEFRKLARELALQIAGYEPRWVSRDDVPDEVLVEEKSVYEAKAQQDGKPEQIIPKIVEGQLEKLFKQICLLEQPYFREPEAHRPGPDQGEHRQAPGEHHGAPLLAL